MFMDRRREVWGFQALWNLEHVKRSKEKLHM